MQDIFKNALMNATPEELFALTQQFNKTPLPLARDKQFRDQAAEFIRQEAARQPIQEAVRGLPLGNRIADITMGAYSDPTHPERSVEQAYGPLGMANTTGEAMLLGANKFLANPAPQVEGLITFPADIATEALKAVISDKPGSAEDFFKETLAGFVAPTGLTDLAEGDMTFPKARESWEEGFLGSLLTADMGGRAFGKIKDKVTGLNERGAVGIDINADPQFKAKEILEKITPTERPTPKQIVKRLQETERAWDAMEKFEVTPATNAPIEFDISNPPQSIFYGLIDKNGAPVEFLRDRKYPTKAGVEFVLNETPEGKWYTVSGANIPDAMRGNGIGTELYKQGIDAINSRGMDVATDPFGTSASSMGSYKHLHEQGYPVNVNPKTEVSTTGHTSAPWDIINDTAPRSALTIPHDYSSRLRSVAVPAAATAAALLADDENKAALAGLAIGSTFFSKARKVSELPSIPKKPQSIIPFLEKNGVTRAEIKELGLFDFLKGKEKVEPAELQKFIDEKSVKLGEDVYGKNDYTQKYNEADGQRLMTLRKIRDKVVASDRAEGVETFPSEAMDFVKLQAANGFRNIKNTYPELNPLFEKYNKENKIASDLFDKRNEASSKEPQFSGYRAIKSQDGVVPGSYTEKFVTADNLTTKDGYLGESWKDEHSNYSDTKNPLVRIRYDVKELPDGRKVMRLQELQDPKEVRRGRSGEGPVPQALSERAMDMGIKQAIADAKKQGLDGIEWSTGEQQRDLYNSALRGVADEARWNPETMELTTYKGGSKTHTEKNVPREKIEDYIGKSGAERLLASKILNTDSYLGPYSVNDTSAGYYVKGKDGRIGQPFKRRIDAENAVKALEESSLHIATDLSIDAKWPGKLYGDFNNSSPKKVTWEKATMDAGFEPYEIEAGSEYFTTGDRSVNVIPFDKGWAIMDENSRLGQKFPTKEQAKKFAEESLSDKSTSGDFNYKATVPSLLKKYGKGEFGKTNPNNGPPTFYEVKPYGEENAPGMHFETKKQALEFLEENELEGTIEPKWIGEDYVGDSQPVMWFTKDTPTNFPIYEGVTGVFSMLQDAIKKEGGGGAKGTAQVAMKYGVPAAALAAWLRADDEGKKKMLAMPVMAGLLVPFKDIKFKGEFTDLKEGVGFKPMSTKDMAIKDFNQADLIPTKNGSTILLGELVDYPGFFEEFPGFKHQQVKFTPEIKKGSALIKDNTLFLPGPKNPGKLTKSDWMKWIQDNRSSLIHEVQHALDKDRSITYGAEHPDKIGWKKYQTNTGEDRGRIAERLRDLPEEGVVGRPYGKYKKVKKSLFNRGKNRPEYEYESDIDYRDLWAD